MKLKIFLRKLTEYEVLEDEINRWVEMNPNLTVEQVEQEIFQNPKTKEAEVMLFLWYSDL
jgi:hypothetical protein